MEKTKILMSFAMAGKGSSFAVWLRDKLMKKLKLYHPNSVYLDNVVSRLDPEATIKVDSRPHMKSSTGARPIGAMLQTWNANYKKALSEARIMLFIYTPEFEDSVWCAQEFGQMQMELGRRHRSKGQPLKSIIIHTTPMCKLPIIHIRDHISLIRAIKVPANGEPLLWDRDDWCISNIDLEKIYREIESIRRMAH